MIQHNLTTNGFVKVKDSFLRKQLLFWIALFLCMALNGQSSKIILPNWQTEISRAISNKGYQSVALQVENKTLSIYYENRVQRFEPRAIVELIKTIEPNELPTNIDVIQLITQKLQQPLVTTKFKLKDFRSWKEEMVTLSTFINTITIKQGGKKLKKELKRTVTNSGNYRLELELKPQIGLGLGGFPDAVVHRFNLLPTFNAYLWKGGQLQMEVILPISSEFKIPGEHFIRPGIIALSQMVRLSETSWLQGRIGYFSENRYGGNLSATQFLWNGSFFLTGNIGYTGYASYPMKLGLDEAVRGWEYSSLNYVDYDIEAAYWFKDWNTQIKLGYGRVLFDKERLKLTVTQKFNEVDIDFFALKTPRGNNYGMQLSIPIFPKKYWKPKRLSVRPAAALNYTYHATQFFAEQYKTGNTILDFYKSLNPEFIKKQLLLPKYWETN